ncbi:hypothetical protein BJG93_35060 [Paraburkholderia sprentiae WSM5005]|uniref:Uncharacterized protein n=1 Tax=Paraburkholderia sprentiae WSM5005 TaxID=754502 RepID=A0A8F4QKM8_9BURK|nr:hypothetical protein BJG93_35060 [Paraburkholderia sprentiae WSM5005]
MPHPKPLLPFKRNGWHIGEACKRAIAFPMRFGLIDKGFFAICNDLETTPGRPWNRNPPMPSALLLEHMQGRRQAQIVRRRQSHDMPHLSRHSKRQSASISLGAILLRRSKK